MTGLMCSHSPAFDSIQTGLNSAQLENSVHVCVGMQPYQNAESFEVHIVKLVHR